MKGKPNSNAQTHPGTRQPGAGPGIHQARKPRLMTRLNQSLAELCGWLLIVVVLFMIVDLVARGFSRPLYGVSELAMFTMIAVVYLGLSHAEERDAHIRVEFLTDKLGGLAARLLTGFITLVSLVTVIIVAWAVWTNAVNAWESRQAIAGPRPILVYPVKFVMFAALVLYGLQLCRRLVAQFRFKRP
ncbi:TRAP transporter small permease [Salinicola corii]|uniref:TRAP transporter small permease protein n=1 Tax=Salinicola corii TaxID=2606937 RepID=A0A640WFM3_9GAMM|nr:TRAP transporter small permease [Salinicola corii]KAA0019054.1 TRAP transporter small permease [Salinicola corii]